MDTDGTVSTREEMAHKSLLHFTTYTYSKYQVAHHHLKIIERLEAVERGEIKRLIITMPPRHGKSELASIRFPAWFLGRNPDKRVIVTSYSIRLAKTFSRQVRNIVRDPSYPKIFPGVALAQDSKANDLWNFCQPYLGGMLAAGVGGSITGQGADLLIIDDPVKDAKEADSLVIRNNIGDWFGTTSYTRLSAEGAIIVVMTRWHEDDIAGRLIKSSGVDGADEWEILHLPAIADEEHDALGRKVGEALWPERFTLKRLLSIKATIFDRAFNALYQGRPTRAEGTIFKRAWMNQRYEPALLEHLTFTRKVQTVDSSFKTGVANDWSVIATWATDGISYYLLDIWRGRVEFPDLKQAVKDQYAKHNPDSVLIEDAASGQSAIQELTRETNIPVIAVGTKGVPKVARAEAISPIFKALKAVLPQSAPWLADWVEEHCAFPQGVSDDQVDTTSMALAQLKVSGPDYHIYNLLNDEDDENEDY